MSRELYVYFRAPERHGDAVQAAAMGMQSQLRSEVPALQARLLRRAGEPSGFDTWMETYAIATSVSAQGVHEALSLTIEKRAATWSHLLEGARHVEGFDPCA